MKRIQSITPHPALSPKWGEGKLFHFLFTRWGKGNPIHLLSPLWERNKVRGTMIIAMLILTLGCKGGKSSARTQEAMEAFPVPVTVVTLSEIKDRVSLFGPLLPKDEVIIFSRVPGKLIKNVVREGDKVKVDDVIALVNRDEVGVRFKESPVKSTMVGVVARLFLSPGAAVAPSIPIAQVFNSSVIKANAGVIEADLGRIKEGQEAYIYVEAHPGKAFPGRVKLVSPVLDPLTHTANIEIEVPNPRGELRPGMYARIDIITGKKSSAIVLPKEAVLHKSGKDIAFVVEGDRVSLKEVTLGFDDLERVEALSGIKEGDLLVVSEQSLLQDGQRVSPETVKDAGSP